MPTKPTARNAIFAVLGLLLAGCNAGAPTAALDATTAFAGAEQGPAAIGSASPAADQNELALVAPTVTNATGSEGIRFTPIIGAPMEAVVPLSQRLRSEAASERLAIKSFQDATSEHTLKGYLSADTFGDKTQVFYVWDVFDAEGRRLHRISGIEEVEATADTPWDAVTPEAMEHIAERTITAYLAWSATHEG